jgi:excisionase family DNA binding protein
MATLATIQIVSTPDVLGGQPCIEGRRISVQHIVKHHIYKGMSLDAMQEAFDLSRAEIYAALSYYYLHQTEIDQSIETEPSAWEAGRATQERLIRLIDSGVSTSEAAARLGITERGVRKLIESGTLPAEKIGEKWFINPADLDREEIANRKRGRPAAKSG